MELKSPSSTTPFSPVNVSFSQSSPALFHSNAKELQGRLLDTTIDDPLTAHSTYDPIIPAAPTRFRRSSFTLEGERPTVLDSLVASASINVPASTVPDVATTRQHSPSDISFPVVSSSSTSILTSSPVIRFSNSENTGDIQSSKSSTQFCDGSAWSSCCTGGLPMNKPSSSLYAGMCTQQKLSSLVYDSDSHRELSSSPFSSVILRRYLAQVASDSPDPSDTPYKLECGRILEESDNQSPRLPECFTLSYPPITSMLIPVRQLHRAHTSNQRIMRPPSVKSEAFREPTSLSDHPFSVVASATSSDVEGGWTILNPPTFNGWGYQSDGHAALDESPEVKQLQQTGRRLQASSLRRSDLNSLRSSVRASTPGSRSAFSVGPNSSVHSSNFDLVHLYDGLLSPKPGRPAFHGSTKSLDVAHRPVYTPPPTPAMSDDGDPASVPRCVPSAPALSLGRLKTWLGQLNPASGTSVTDDDQYYYMDDKSLERRERAQASNVISPVTF